MRQSGRGIGLDPLDWTGLYNTPVPPAQQSAYAAWLAELSRTKEHDSRLDLRDYDLQGAYLDQIGRDERGHMDDSRKKPNHPTFSQESVYSRPGTMEGGQWVQHRPGRWDYQASPLNLRFRTPMELGRYFQEEEPNSRLYLPPAVHSNGIGIGY